MTTIATPSTVKAASRIVLAARPLGAPTADTFRLESAPIPQVQDGQVLLRTIYLSLDPYMRGRMSDAKSYAEPVQLGDVMVGGNLVVDKGVVVATLPKSGS